MRKFNRFQAGSGCFKCVICERMTRDTGQGVEHLCEDCYEIAGIDNHFNDGGDNEAYRTEANQRLEHIRKLGGNVQRVIDSNEYVWPKGRTEEKVETTVAQVEQIEEVKPTTEVQPTKKESKMSKKSRALSKTQKTVNLVAKFDGKVKSGELVAKILSTCKFTNERTARRYLGLAREKIKAGKASVTPARKRSAKKAVAQVESNSEAA